MVAVAGVFYFGGSSFVDLDQRQFIVERGDADLFVGHDKELAIRNAMKPASAGFIISPVVLTFASCHFHGTFKFDDQFAGGRLIKGLDPA